jgi:hypothetical protein
MTKQMGCDIFTFMDETTLPYRSLVGVPFMGTRRSTPITNIFILEQDVSRVSFGQTIETRKLIRA